ncbi:MAG: MMPL family transporter [Pseudomonadota bacterium]
MKGTEKVVQNYVAFLLRHRVAALLVIAVITLFFGYSASQLKIATDFVSFYPPKHPFIEVYNQYRNMFGSANVLVTAIEVRNGDIYNWETIDKINRITAEMLTIKGCNPAQLISITHPKLKNVEVTGYGIAMKPIVHAGLSRTQEGLDEIKRSIYSNEGVRGFFVSPDDKAAAIFAGFWEEGGEPRNLYEKMMQIKEREEDDNHRIHFTGYPGLYAYIYNLAPQIYTVLGLSILVIIGLLFFYFRTWQGVFVPLAAACLSAVWGLGFASMLGYALDPLILVVPLIITARAISHAVQCMARYYEEYLNLGNQREAIVLGYGELFAPAFLSIVTDALGLLLISVATIPLMRQLGFFCSFWIVTIVVSVLTLNPILLSYLRAPDLDILNRDVKGNFYDRIARVLVAPASKKAGRYAILFITLFIIIVGGYFALKLKVGNTEAGAAILFPSHPYNKASRFFNENFVGSTQLVILAEGQKEGAIKDYETLRTIEDFQIHMETKGGAGGTLTFNNLIKRVYRMFHEGNPKWEMLPKDPSHLGQIGFIIRNSASPGEMDQWIDYSWTNATITCFYKSYNYEVIKNSIAQARAFIASHTSDRVKFRLAGGLMGILFAVNEEVNYSYWVSLAVVFSAVLLLCVLTFRSFAAGMILIVPLAISQIVSEVFMLWWGIDLNINSLPVAAIAVGIGIDYGIYLMARIAEEYEKCGDYQHANLRAVETTGKTIIFTASTLIAGVVFWVFVNLKFQSEMGLLLGLLMLLNMVNALVFIPSLVSLFKPGFVVNRAPVM